MLRFDSPGPDLTRALTMFTGCEIVRDRQARTITVTIRNYTQKLAVRYKGKFTLNDLPYAASKAKREEFESDAPSSCMQKKEGDMQDSSNMQKKEGDVSENARVINEGIEALQAAKFRSLEYCITILKHAKQRAEERSIAKGGAPSGARPPPRGQRAPFQRAFPRRFQQSSQPHRRFIRPRRTVLPAGHRAYESARRADRRSSGRQPLLT